MRDQEADAIAAFTLAEYLAQTDSFENALDQFSALEEHPWEPIHSKVLLRSTELKLENDIIEPEKAIDLLESLRYRWRGDNSEVNAAAMLGKVYAREGRQDEALRIMKITQKRFSKLPVAGELSREMSDIFRQLFINGGAKNMDPATRVALWRDHQTLTPNGPDGVRMVMNIVRDLVALNLLDDAASYLQYWIDQPNITLTARARAQIARDLAEIYILNGQMQKAINAINETRVARLPSKLVTERRSLYALALSKVGQTENALELLANDKNVEAKSMRGQIAWEGKLWDRSGALIETALGNSWQNDTLTRAQSLDVMRAMISFALINDTVSIKRVGKRYQKLMEPTDYAAAFDLLLNEPINNSDVRLRNLIRELASFEPSETLSKGFQLIEDDLN